MVLLLATSLRAGAAPYAALVMDARSGEVLHATNADTRLHPASLTKMMTLYIAFEAVKNGEIGLDSKILVSRNAANEVPSKLGLKEGQKIELRYLIRAAAVKSANDASTAIAEGISGSEAAFARRMNRTAKALGMTRTTFKNAHGLTEAGHLSTARDMTILGRHLFYDYPEYYNLFSRVSTDAKVATVHHTNRKFLAAYKGADGIKTGYTRAAGFNLTASAERGGERIIATVFGGNSTASRNAKMAELMDLGFRKAPSNVAVRRPSLPVYDEEVPVAGKTIRVIRAVAQSVRPQQRPGAATGEGEVVLASAEPADADDAIAKALEAATAATAELMASPRPRAPEEADVASADAEDTGEAAEEEVVASADATDTAAPEAAPAPEPKPRRADYAAVAREAAPSAAPEIVSRISTSGSRHWGINVGRFPSRFDAEKILLKTALAEMATLDGALRKVAQRGGGFDANFVGMSEDQAALACRRLLARGLSCETLGPG